MKPRTRSSKRDVVLEAPPVVKWVATGVMTLMAGVALLAFAGPWSALIAGPVVGVLAAICIRRYREAAAAAGLASGLAVVVVNILLGVAPDLAVGGSVERLGTLAALALTVTAAGAVAGLLAWRLDPEHVTALDDVAAVIAILLVFAGLLSGASLSGFRAEAGRRLQPGEYAYDGAIYQQAYMRMLDGEGYYNSIVHAAAGDARLMREGAVVDGVFVGWAYSATFIRQPAAAYLWRTVAPNGGSGVYDASMLAGLALMLGSYVAFRPHLGARALFVSISLMPLIMWHTIWHNLFMPDWWAGLALAGSLLFAFRRRFFAAASLALLAGLLRETALIWLVILVFIGLLSAMRGERAGWARAGFAAALCGVFAVAYSLHLRAGTPYIAPGGVDMGIVDMLVASAKRPLVERFVWSAGYNLQPYAFVMGRPEIAVFLQLPGLWLVFRRDSLARLAALSFALFWFVFTLTIGATSSYWGQLYTPLAIMGTAALVACFAPGPLPPAEAPVVALPKGGGKRRH